MLKFKVQSGNTKLGKGIYVINQPAGKTCQCDAPCNKKGLCYAQKGTFLFKSVQTCYANNLARFLEDREGAKMDILSQLPYMGFVRIHASGDFVNHDYLEMIIEIATLLPNVKFMAYTKKYELINKHVEEFGLIPDNLTIIFSLWDGYKCDNRHNFPTSQVILKEGNKDTIKGGYECTGQCDKCFKCWTLQKGENVLFNQH